MNTLLLHAALLSAFAVEPQESPEAKALYADMLETVLKSDSLQVDFKFDIKLKSSTLKTAEGKMLLQNPGLFTFKIDETTKGKKESSTFVADGTVIKANDKPPQPVKEGFVDTYRAMVGMMGLSTWLNNKAVRAGEPDIKDVKLGKKETIGGVEAQAVSLTLDYGKPELIVTTTAWIDPKTKLPVRRVTKVKQGDNEIEFSETLTIKVGERFDPKLFVVPK